MTIKDKIIDAVCLIILIFAVLLLEWIVTEWSLYAGSLIYMVVFWVAVAPLSIWLTNKLVP